MTKEELDLYNLVTKDQDFLKVTRLFGTSLDLKKDKLVDRVCGTTFWRQNRCANDGVWAKVWTEIAITASQFLEEEKE